jgi:predicted transcriptional regulator
MNTTEIKPLSEKDFLSLIDMKFVDVVQPTYKENKAKGYVSYGEKNDYPNYLLEKFDNCGKHGAIVSGKADFIVGNGFAFVENESEIDNAKARVLIDRANNDGETLDEVASKVALDVEIFGGGYLEILFNKKKKVSEIYHLDFSKVRPAKDLKTFYFSEEWHKESNGILTENSKAEIIPIKAFNPLNPAGKMVLYVREYKPNMDVYPKPSYFAAMRYIQIDIAIGEYHLNGISNGMFASKMINFNNGVPKEEDQKAVEKKVNNKFAGSKNAGKVLISFNKSQENATTVLDLSGTELDKHFDLLAKTTETQIFSSHRVTSPGLFGIRSEGAFSKEDLRPAFELFENTYVSRKRKLIEKNINTVLSINDIPSVYLQRSEPIGIQWSEATIKTVLTEDEIRESLGKKPKTQEQKTKTATPATGAEAEGTAAKFSAADDERDALVFAKFGRQRSDFDIYRTIKSGFENDFQFMKSHFETETKLSSDQKKILEIIDEDPTITTENISKALNISVREIEGYLKSLESDGLIEVSTESGGTARNLTDNGRGSIEGGGETTSIKVMYGYAGPQDSRNRPFCAKLLELDRLYTRADIEQISLRLGYSVWDRRGGWYRPKGSSEARAYCRHTWETHTVISKS